MNHAPESSAEVTAEATRTAERITVTLLPDPAADLAALQERTGLGKTDIINRAVTLYEFIDTQIRAGADILVRHDGETHLVAFL